jgi:glycosyltransferase involved in cell wall biosynthesis
VSTPLVSIIIPTFNRAKHLKQTLESVAKQSYKQWECLVCDDGSTDGTAELIRTFSATDNRISPLTGDRFGLPAGPRNRGMHAARGEWVAFLDDDDLWHPTKLETQLKLIRGEGWDFIATSAVKVPDSDSSPFAGGEDDENISVNVLLVDPLRDGNPIVNSSVMVRTELVRRVGGQNESPLYRAVEDFDLWARLHSSGVALRIMGGRPLVGYRVGEPNSISATHRVREPDVVRQRWAQIVILLELWRAKGRPTAVRTTLADRVADCGSLSLWIGDEVSWQRSIKLFSLLDRKLRRVKPLAQALVSLSLAYSRKRVARATRAQLADARELSQLALRIARSA